MRIQDYEKALEYFHKAAGMGNASSVFMIGECYYNGHNLVHTALDYFAV